MSQGAYQENDLFKTQEVIRENVCYSRIILIKKKIRTTVDFIFESKKRARKIIRDIRLLTYMNFI